MKDGTKVPQTLFGSLKNKSTHFLGNVLRRLNIIGITLTLVTRSPYGFDMVGFLGSVIKGVQVQYVIKGTEMDWRTWCVGSTAKAVTFCMYW
jgi:hypothetical protein